MADISEKVSQIAAMVEKGQYFFSLINQLLQVHI